MNALDAITSLALDAEPCHRSKVLPELCETHGVEINGIECEMVLDWRRQIRLALNVLTPVMVDWLAGMIEGAAEGLSGESEMELVRAGYRGAAHLIRQWDPWLEFEDEPAT